MSTAAGPHDHHEPDDTAAAGQAPPRYEQARDQQPPRYEQAPSEQPAYGQPQYGQQPYSEANQPLTGTVEMAPDQQRLWGTLAHLSSLVALILLPATVGLIYTGAIGPLVIFLVLKDRGVFVRRQAVEALNFQILATVVYFGGVIIGGLISLVTFGFGLLVIVPIAIILVAAALVFQIIAAVKANQGIDYRYPLNWRLVK